MKRCFRCQKVKSLSAFYCHPQMADGHLNKCIECTKGDAAKHRNENIEKIREYDRQRGLLPQRKKAVRERYKKRVKTKVGREMKRRRQKRWAENNKIKRACHVLVRNALQNKKIKKEPCANCNSKKNVHAHHEDYLLPFEITWLCQKCHGKRHREINETKRLQK